MRLAARIQREREEGVRGLRLPVRDPLVVRTALEVRVLEVDSSIRVPSRRQSDDARAVRLAQRRPEARSELEVAEVVRGELRLEAPPIPDEWSRHDPGVVDQDVK